MNAKKMEEIYVTYGLCEDTWNMFYNMRLHNIISEKTWARFYENCAHLEFGEVGGVIINSLTGLPVYVTDDAGFWNKVK